MVMRSMIPYSWARNTPSEIKRDPFSALQTEMNRLFESFGPFPATHWSSDMTPRLDVSETDVEIDIDAELPGVEEKDVDVTLLGDVLTIRGERKNGHEEKNKNYYVAERSYGSFTRSVTLPFDVDPKNVTAKFNKGVLHIAIPKPANMTAKSAKIPVKPA
ncbi:MAG TPA: Hsp20/alpha crystallin family protein [Micropepsaceae bacterium]|nr:Hsp20/alpha crystallin family protein [Micropepsaceae bacterium]